MSKHALLAISPVDGRYAAQTAPLVAYFSEYALIRYRLRVEIEYLIALAELPLPGLVLGEKHFDELRALYGDFTAADAQRIKEIEQVTNHDVKAVEYFIKERLDKLGLTDIKEFVHFGLTSQDVNNTAVPLLLQEAMAEVMRPLLDDTHKHLTALAAAWQEVPMLARTHGQPASPTRLGKEVAVFAARLQNQLTMLAEVPFAAKFGGATGNMNAHYAAYPDIDWHDFAFRFLLDRFNLDRSYPTTQIDHYDYLAAFFDNLKRINTILIDLARDMWQYISLGYFRQKIKEGEVGSSAMPHKVNPIDFENAEGNLGLANALYEHLAAKLPVSRLQRDLTDSTVLRNVGVPLAHSLIALRSLHKGLTKLELHREAIEADLEANWAVVAEGIQNILRREGYPQPYEALKGLTRTNETVNRETIRAFIDSLDVEEEVKEELRQLSPFNYLGR